MLVGERPAVSAPRDPAPSLPLHFVDPLLGLEAAHIALPKGVQNGPPQIPSRVRRGVLGRDGGDAPLDPARVAGEEGDAVGVLIGQGEVVCSLSDRGLLATGELHERLRGRCRDVIDVGSQGLACAGGLDDGPASSIEVRLIDLSYAAAVKLGYMESGTANVEVEVLNIAGVDDRRGTVSGSYRYLQMGAFGSESSALRLQGELQALLTTDVSISPVESGGSMLYRVRVGPVASNDELLSVQQTLQDKGYGSGQPLP